MMTEHTINIEGQALYLPLDDPYWEVYREFVDPVAEARTWTIVYDDREAAIRALYERAYTSSVKFQVLACSDAMRALQVPYCVLCGGPIHPDSDLFDVEAEEPMHLACGRRE